MIEELTIINKKTMWRLTDTDTQRWAVSPILYYLISLSIIEIIKVSISVSIKAKIVSNIGIYYNRVLN